MNIKFPRGKYQPIVLARDFDTWTVLANDNTEEFSADLQKAGHYDPYPDSSLFGLIDADKVFL